MTTTIPTPLPRQSFNTTFSYDHEEACTEYVISVRTPKTRKRVGYMTGVQRQDSTVERVSSFGTAPSDCLILGTQWAVWIYTLHNGTQVNDPEANYFNTEEDATRWAEFAVREKIARANGRQNRQRIERLLDRC